METSLAFLGITIAVLVFAAYQVFLETYSLGFGLIPSFLKSTIYIYAAISTTIVVLNPSTQTAISVAVCMFVIAVERIVVALTGSFANEIVRRSRRK
jgi:hypothetical protein